MSGERIFILHRNVPRSLNNGSPILVRRIITLCTGLALVFSLVTAFGADSSSNLPKNKNEGTTKLKIIQDKAKDKESKILQKGLQIAPAIITGSSCVLRKASVVAACCNLNLPDIQSQLPDVSLFEYDCPLLGQSGQIPCIENPPDPGEVDRSGNTPEERTPAACNAALEDYEDQGWSTQRSTL